MRIDRALLVALLLVGCASADSSRHVAEGGTARRSSGRSFVPRAAPTDTEWLRTPPPRLPPRPLETTPVVERRLGNGARVLVLERHDFPSVALTFVLDRGLCDGGLAAAIYARALGSSPGRTRAENFRYLDDVATPVSSRVTEDATVLETTVLTPLLASALSRLTPMFFAPGLEADDLERARQALNDRLVLAGSRQERLAARALRGALFGRRAYGTVLVDTSELEEEPDARVRAFRQAALSPRHATVIAVGDTNADHVVALLERYTDGLPRSEVAASACGALPAPELTSEIRVLDDPGAEQSRVYVGAVGVPAGHADGPALDVLTGALGASLSSRLNVKIREEHGYTYGVRMQSHQWRAHGLIEVTTSVETRRTAEAVQGLLTELDRLESAPIDGAELARARGLALPDEGEHAAAARELVATAAYGLPADAARARSRAIAVVTSAQVTRVAAKYLASSRRVITIVGDASRIVRPLQQLGLADVVVEGR